MNLERYSLGLVAYILLKAVEKWLIDSNPVFSHTCQMLSTSPSRSRLASSSRIVRK